MESLLLAICAEGDFPCADLVALLETEIFTLKVLDFSAQFMYVGHEALVSGCEGGVF